jgi:hypothetical protein
MRVSISRIILASTITLLFVSFTFSQERTKINDKAAAQMLLGRHKLSLQWISWDYFGNANVTNTRGVYRVKGQQRGKGTEDLLTVDGTVVSIDAKEFVFSGKIVMQVSHINGGRPCVRDGEFTFKITGKRKYWRMQEMDNPCDGVTDYVDIYFR